MEKFIKKERAQKQGSADGLALSKYFKKEKIACKEIELKILSMSSCGCLLQF